VVAATLLAVAGCSMPAAVPASRLDPERGRGEARTLIDLAKVNLQAQLDVQSTEIVVQSVESLLFPHLHRALNDAGWDEGHRGSSGYTIKLVAAGSVYEYNGRVIGSSYVLWREL
jgi:hypothetical protein